MRHSPATKAAVVADYAAGYRVKDITARRGVSPESVRLWARQAGIARHGGEFTGRCTACSAPRAQVDGLCRPCAAELPLSGGRWVPNGRGTVVWQAGMGVAS